nr:hypothetical protein [Haloferax sp. KTX1]
MRPLSAAAATLGQQLFVVVDYLLLVRIGVVETLAESRVRAAKRLVLALERLSAPCVGSRRRTAAA